MPNALTVNLVYCTCPDAETATRIAETLVAERLAACVNLVPGVRSIYRWQENVEDVDEVLLLIKTGGDRLGALGARIGELHPYELPEVLAVEASGGSAGYLGWIADATRCGAKMQ